MLGVFPRAPFRILKRPSWADLMPRTSYVLIGVCSKPKVADAPEALGNDDLMPLDAP